MYYKQIVAIFAILTALSQAAPVLDERFKLELGMSTINLPDGAVAFRREINGPGMGKRIIVDGPDGTTLKPTPIGSTHFEPMKRAIVKESNGTIIEPTPIGSDGMEPMKRYIIEGPDGTITRPSAGSGRIEPM